MNQHAAIRNDTQPSASSTSGENAARPKVLKRPAQFSQPAAKLANERPTLPELKIDALNTHTNSSEKPHTITARGWQDDARFAFALLAIVIVVNIAVSIWLNAMSTHSAAAAPTSVNAEQSAPAPGVDSTASLIHVLDQAGQTASEQ